MVETFLVEAIARDLLGDVDTAERALERALDLAEPDGVLLPFLLHPTPTLLERHSRHRTTHASLVSDIIDLQAGRQRPSRLAAPQPPLEPLSATETQCPALPPDSPLIAGSRQRALPVAEHHQGAHPQYLLKARRPRPQRGHRARPRSQAARAVPARSLIPLHGRSASAHASRRFARPQRLVAHSAKPPEKDEVTATARASAPALDLILLCSSSGTGRDERGERKVRLPLMFTPCGRLHFNPSPSDALRQRRETNKRGSTAQY